MTTGTEETEEAVMDNYIGKLLDERYEILDVIGTGGMAVVYKALCHRLNRMVAIKILKDEFSRDEEFRRRFHAESQAVAMLSHPNIVSVYDVSHSGGVDYIVMELIEGITLKQYLTRKHALDWRETLHISMQIAKALEHAHSRGIIHRDIKPHNIMILRDGSIKVADFGIARILSEKNNTLTRETLGSVHYISPEQAKGAHVDARSDLYSLGVVMYEMLTGQPPYDGETPVSVAIQHISGGAALPSSIVGGIPRGLEQITLHAMTANAELRYASATEMLRDMDEFRKDPHIEFSFDANAGTSLVHSQEPRPAAAAAPAAPDDGLTPEQRRAAREQRERAERDEKRKTVLIWVAIGAVIALLAAILVIVLVNNGNDDPDTPSGTGSSNTVIVPNFVGKYLAEIEPAMYPELVIDVDGATFEYNDEYARGQIIDQTPQSGEEVRGGKTRTVRLTVSLGRRNDEMLDLTGQSYDNALSQLSAMNYGLQIREEKIGSEDIPVGSVVRTEPAAGEKLDRGQRVILYVSLGSTTMPDLTGELLENARQLIAAMEKNLSLNIVPLQELSDTVPEGYVTRSEPAAGSKLSVRDTVRIYYSIGDGKTEVPQMLGFTQLDAAMLLQAAGLGCDVVEVYDDTVEVGKVVSQSEEPFTRVEKGTVVILSISKGPQPPDIPTEPTDPTEIEEEPRMAAPRKKQ